MKIRLALWNVEWKTPGSPAGGEIRSILNRAGADIICLTEGYAGLLPDSGYQILANPDYGYGTVDGRRKVLLWSRWPWTAVDIVGSPSLPAGRFVRGQVATPAGPIVVIGVCIPWSGAHVSTGRRDRIRWQDHQQYLEALRDLIAKERPQNHLIVAGDFNQRLPPSHTPFAMHNLLRAALGDLHVCTEGPLSGIKTLSIDHVAHSNAFTALAVTPWSALAANGRKLSDHFGLSVDLQFTPDC